MQQPDLGAAEQLVQASVDLIHLVVGPLGVEVGLVRADALRARRPHRRLDVGKFPGCHPAEQRRAACRDLGHIRHVYFAAAGVCEQLHHQRAALGDPAARHDLGQLEPVLLEVVHDPPAAERDRLEQRPVDLLARALQREPEDRAAEIGVGEDRPVAVEPVECDQPGLARLEPRRRCFQRLVTPWIGDHLFDEPGEHVADRRLPRLVAVEPRKDAVLDDAGDAGQPDLLGMDDHVADRRADDDHEAARLLHPYSGDRNPRVDVADRHRNRLGQPHSLAPPPAQACPHAFPAATNVSPSFSPGASNPG